MTKVQISSTMPKSSDEQPFTQILQYRSQIIKDYLSISKNAASLSKQWFNILHDDQIDEQVRSLLQSDLLLAIQETDKHLNDIATNLRTITETMAYYFDQNSIKTMGDNFLNIDLPFSI